MKLAKNMKFRYTNVHDNVVEEEKFLQESDHFPLEWFDEHPADEGGNSTIEAEKDKILVETREFEEIYICIRYSKDRDKTATKKLVQKFLDDLINLESNDENLG